MLIIVFLFVASKNIVSVFTLHPLRTLIGAVISKKEVEIFKIMSKTTAAMPMCCFNMLKEIKLHMVL